MSKRAHNYDPRSVVPGKTSRDTTIKRRLASVDKLQNVSYATYRDDLFYQAIKAWGGAKGERKALKFNEALELAKDLTHPFDAVDYFPKTFEKNPQALEDLKNARAQALYQELKNTTNSHENLKKFDAQIHEGIFLFKKKLYDLFKNELTPSSQDEPSILSEEEKFELLEKTVDHTNLLGHVFSQHQDLIHFEKTKTQIAIETEYAIRLFNRLREIRVTSKEDNEQNIKEIDNLIKKGEMYKKLLSNHLETIMKSKNTQDDEKYALRDAIVEKDEQGKPTTALGKVLWGEESPSFLSFFSGTLDEKLSTRLTGYIESSSSRRHQNSSHS